MSKKSFTIKFTLSIMCIIIFVPAVMAQTPAPSFVVKCGDTNEDGNVDIVDALLIAQVYVGMDPVNFNNDAADVDQNDMIDIVDALLIAQYYVALIDSLSCRYVLPVLENAFEVIRFTSQAWYGGVYGSGGGTDFSGYLKVIIPVVDSILGVWIDDRYYTPSVTNLTSPDTIPYSEDDELLLTFAYRWIPDVPELEIEPMEDPPLGNSPYFEGAALIVFKIDGKVRGFIVDTIEELEPIYYP